LRVFFVSAIFGWYAKYRLRIMTDIVVNRYSRAVTLFWQSISRYYARFRKTLPHGVSCQRRRCSVAKGQIAVINFDLKDAHAVSHAHTISAGFNIIS